MRKRKREKEEEKEREGGAEKHRTGAKITSLKFNPHPWKPIAQPPPLCLLPSPWHPQHCVHTQKMKCHDNFHNSSQNLQTVKPSKAKTYEKWVSSVKDN